MKTEKQIGEWFKSITKMHNQQMEEKRKLEPVISAQQEYINAINEVLSNIENNRVEQYFANVESVLARL